MKKVKKIFTNWRILLLLFFLVISIILISPKPGNEGAAIRNVVKNSSAHLAGIHAPLPEDKPIFREVITEVNGRVIKNANDYNSLVSEFKANETVIIKSRSNYIYNGDERKLSLFKSIKTYNLVVKPLYSTIILNETEQITIEKIISQNVTINGTTVLVNKTVDVIKEIPKTRQIVIGIEGIGLDVYDAPKTNIRKGLDLEGGTRVLLAPEENSNVTSDDLEIIMNNLDNRLNIYGLSDMVIRSVSDLAGNKLILVEIAGANQDEVRDLISKQGKFEAKIGNETIFRGGQGLTVCRSSDCSFGIDPMRPCGKMDDGNWQCQFRFDITLSFEHAKKFAEVTKDMEIINDEGYEHLSLPLSLVLDNELVDELRISAGLRGKAETGISISGPGIGMTHQEAATNSAKNMKNLQTVLITGSLPVKLDVVKIDSVSPSLGKEFLRNAIVVGLFAILAVAAVVFIRYRQIKIALPMVFIMASEVIIILGFAALAGWNLDLAAIAGIIIAVGTGVDHQIVIVDETRRGNKSSINWKEQIKRAFFIIFAAFFTTLVAMIPLIWAGAGLLRGFAITTIIGIMAGVLVARPAFAQIVEILLKD